MKTLGDIAHRPNPVVYRLDPIPTKLDDPKWQKSMVKECVRVLADTAVEARQKVGRITAISTGGGERTAAVSPWLDETLTTICVDTKGRTADGQSREPAAATISPSAPLTWAPLPKPASRVPTAPAPPNQTAKPLAPPPKPDQPDIERDAERAMEQAHAAAKGHAKRGPGGGRLRMRNDVNVNALSDPRNFFETTGLNDDYIRMRRKIDNIARYRRSMRTAGDPGASGVLTNRDD
jgi:hypothetical protein